MDSFRFKLQWRKDLWILLGLNCNDGKIRGVNLGGWLVLEEWMTPKLFDDFQNQFGGLYNFSQKKKEYMYVFLSFSSLKSGFTSEVKVCNASVKWREELYYMYISDLQVVINFSLKGFLHISGLFRASQGAYKITCNNGCKNHNKFFFLMLHFQKSS